MAVDSTEAIAWSAVLRAAPANHFALWSEGSLSISSWNWLLFFTGEGASKSCIILNTDMICRFSGGQYSAISRMTDVSNPSAAS